MREGAGEPLSELLGICFMMFKATRPRDAASGGASSTGPVSYTHLDVYKRQRVGHVGHGRGYGKIRRTRAPTGGGSRDRLGCDSGGHGGQPSVFFTAIDGTGIPCQPRRKRGKYPCLLYTSSTLSAIISLNHAEVTALVTPVSRSTAISIQRGASSSKRIDVYKRQRQHEAEGLHTA